MPTPTLLKAPFIPENFFHLISKSIDGLLLFNDPKDYALYAKTFHKYTNDFLDTWSYSLLGNHSHHVVKMKAAEEIISNLLRIKKKHRTAAANRFLKDPENERLFDLMIERQINSFLVSFAFNCNIKYERRGGLFQKPFKRIHISDENHLQQAIIYTHINAQKHGFVKDFCNHEYSSYQQILANDCTYVNCDDVINFFGGEPNFIQLHREQADLYFRH